MLSIGGEGVLIDSWLIRIDCCYKPRYCEIHDWAVSADLELMSKVACNNSHHQSTLSHHHHKSSIIITSHHHHQLSASVTIISDHLTNTFGKPRYRQVLYWSVSKTFYGNSYWCAHCWRLGCCRPRPDRGAASAYTWSADSHRRWRWIHTHCSVRCSTLSAESLSSRSDFWSFDRFAPFCALNIAITNTETLLWWIILHTVEGIFGWLRL